MHQVSVKSRGKAVLTKDQTAELREAFTLFDSDHKGSLDARELKAAIRAMGFDVNKEQVRKMITDIGKSNTELFGFEDFVDIIRPRLHEKGSREDVMKIFQLFDEEQTGVITFKQLRKIAQDIGDSISDEDLREMLNEADRDGDGGLSFEEFYRVMKRRNDDPLACWSDTDEGG